MESYMIKEFLEKYTHLKIAIQQLEIHGGCFRIQVYNTTYDNFEPVFEHFITNFEISNAAFDFETAIVVPITNWLEECKMKRESYE